MTAVIIVAIVWTLLGVWCWFAGGKIERWQDEALDRQAGEYVKRLQDRASRTK